MEKHLEEIQELRELERIALNDVKQVNNIVKLQKKVLSKQTHKDVRIAAIHCLRRLFLGYIENDKVTKPEKKDLTSNIRKFYTWFVEKYITYQNSLCQLISENCVWALELSIRTLIEFIKKDHLFLDNRGEIKYIAYGSPFGIYTFNKLLDALIDSKEEIDADVLIMIKDEIFNNQDCVFYVLKYLKEKIQMVKQQQDKQTVEYIQKKNLLDLLRMIVLPSNDEEAEYLVDLPSINSKSDEQDDDSQVSDESDPEDEETPANKDNKTAADTKDSKKRALLDMLSGKDTLAKRSKKKSKTNKNKLNERQKIEDVASYKQIYSSVWLLLVSLSFETSEHKIILKHIANYAMEQMSSPILLSDYLTQCYNMGSVLSIYALESLLTLIIKYNLDYPKYFVSLYKLLTLENFNYNTKLREKFLKLLSFSLKSTNMPAYQVAAFIKRLARIAIHSTCMNAYYCLVQITMLLRQNPSCQVLIQRSLNSISDKDEFNNDENEDLEKANALNSSLWELDFLQNHPIIEVTKLAKNLQSPDSTSLLSPALIVETYISHNYHDTITSLHRSKWRKEEAELAFRKPTSLFGQSHYLKHIAPVAQPITTTNNTN